MKGITRRSGYRLVGAGVGLAALSIFFTFVPNLPGQGRGGQQQEGPTPRTADGHPDLSGRYLFVGGNPSQESPVFRPETKAKYQNPVPSGACVMGGTPTTITMQTTEHGPIELVQRPGILWILAESPQSVLWIPTDGRPHSDDPDVSFIGESVGRWESATLVVDTVGIDTRMRNISVGLRGFANAWTHSEKEHVIQRFSRPSKNVLIYQVTVEDPIVLAKPFTSAPLRWSLTQGVDDHWKPKVPIAGCDF
jgi:hypothetical protein